jgi:hypothetical protein
LELKPPDDVWNELNDWIKKFGSQTPQQQQQVKDELDTWKVAFHGKTMEQVKTKYKDRKKKFMNLLDAIVADEQKELKEENKS